MIKGKEVAWLVGQMRAHRVSQVVISLYETARDVSPDAGPSWMSQVLLFKDTPMVGEGVNQPELGAPIISGK